MPKTGYATRMTAEAFAERTKNMTPEAREDCRLNDLMGPLFDMWLRFKDVFADRALDRLDISDEEAEAMAKKMEGLPSGDAFAFLLRTIADRRRQRRVRYMVEAVWASSDGPPQGMGIEEIYDRFEKLPKGSA